MLERIKKKYRSYDKKDVMVRAFSLGLVVGLAFGLIMLPVIIFLPTALSLSAFLGAPMVFAIGFTLATAAAYFAKATFDVMTDGKGMQVVKGSATRITDALSKSYREFTQTDEASQNPLLEPKERTASFSFAGINLSSVLNWMSPKKTTTAVDTPDLLAQETIKSKI